ncbi:hypothetical protein N9260_00020 [bacterium]|nr:hypothetical protein [bacterium]
MSYLFAARQSGFIGKLMDGDVVAWSFIGGAITIMLLIKWWKSKRRGK